MILVLECHFAAESLGDSLIYIFIYIQLLNQLMLTAWEGPVI